MRKIGICILVCFSVSLSFAQDWMTDLDIAERLALTQNKLIVAVWENSYYDGASANINLDQGKKVFIENMYDQPVIDSLLWAHFVPVVLSENDYPELFDKIKNKRSTSYIDKFHDESIKVLDANGNILNVSSDYYLLNLSEFIQKYSMNMSFLKAKAFNYKNDKNFYSAFYLAAAYMDFAFFANNNNVRSELVDLSSIYLDEASEYLKIEAFENEAALEQRVELLELQKELILENPKKVIRKLNRIKESEVAKPNMGLRSFLYFSSYIMLGDQQDASVWESDVTVLDRKKIINLINARSK